MVVIFTCLFACLATCIIESIPVLFLKNRKMWLKAVCICNLLTNPILNLIVMILEAFEISNFLLYAIVIILELAAVAFEAFLLHNITDESVKKCIIISVVCNVCSFVIGLFLNHEILIAMEESETVITRGNIFGKNF